MRRTPRSTRSQPAVGETDVAALLCACATVRRASRAVTQLYDSWLRPHGIEGPQFALLATLDRFGGCTQSTIGHRFDLDKTTLSRNLRLMHRKGWIAVAAGADARERRVMLTPAGRRRLESARPAWRKAQEQLQSSMSADQWNEMLSVFDGVTHAARVARRGDSHVTNARA